MRKIIQTLLLAVALALPSSAYAEGERFVLISHAPDSDSWWNTIKTAIGEAGRDIGVEVEYRNPPTGDLADMARIIEQVTASKPDGIISTIADYDEQDKWDQQCLEEGQASLYFYPRSVKEFFSFIVPTAEADNTAAESCGKVKAGGTDGQARCGSVKGCTWNNSLAECVSSDAGEIHFFVPVEIPSSEESKPEPDEAATEAECNAGVNDGTDGQAYCRSKEGCKWNDIGA